MFVIISPIEVNGMISRAQDVSALRHNEVEKDVIDQNNFHNKFAHEVDQNARTVHHADDSDKTDTKHDAKEKGRNEYTSGDGKHKKQKEKDGKVTIKQQSGFDIKI